MPSPAVAGYVRPLAPYEPPIRPVSEPPTPPRPRRPDDQLALDLWNHDTQHVDDPPPTYDIDRLKTVLTALVEVYAGSRSARQVRTAVTPHLFARLNGGTERRMSRCSLRGVRACQPGTGVIEVSGVAEIRTRTHAVCARFEEGEHGWVCTVFEVLRPGMANTRAHIAQSRTREREWATREV